MDIKKQYLENEEYYHDVVTKKTIYIHHTAGSHRPDWVVASWERDKTGSGGVRHIATAYVIGGKSTRNANTDFDGVVVECHPPEKWAHHLGIKARNNKKLNQESIGIEICNYGPLTKKGDEYFTYVNSKVPAADVVDLGYEFRGFRYYHAYTPAQIQATKDLVTKLGKDFNIDLSKGMKMLLDGPSIMPEGLDTLGQQKWLNVQGYIGGNGKVLTEDGLAGGSTSNTNYAIDSYKEALKGKAFELNKQALAGAEGVWTHTNVRPDKFDVSPQPAVIEMIKELGE
tara:strand:- start:971 stop:1822 length:852 start_codon:yes stop_codon:yes gene_type:complete